MKPASKALGLHGVFMGGKGLKYLIADGAFKRMQVDACACWLDTSKRHRGVALRTSRALNCHEWNDGRKGLRLGHDASLNRRDRNTLCHRKCLEGGAVIAKIYAARDLKRELIRGQMEGK